MLFGKFFLVFDHFSEGSEALVLVLVLGLLGHDLLEALLVGDLGRHIEVSHAHILHYLLHVIEVTVLGSYQHGLSSCLYEILLLNQECLVLQLFLLGLLLLELVDCFLEDAPLQLSLSLGLLGIDGDHLL